MAIFGITLKKLEAIPSDIVHGVEGVFGGNNPPQNKPSAPTANPNQYAASATGNMGAKAPSPGINPALLQPPPSASPDNAPRDGDIAGLRKALGGINAYSQDDQARIINRASKAGLIAHNVAAATQNQILSPTLSTDRSPLGELAQAGENVLLPGASNLARQVGTNLASSNLLDKSLKGQYDPAAVSNTLDEANANNGGIVDNLKGIDYGKLADTSAQGAMGLAGVLTAPELGAFAARNAGRVEAMANKGGDYLKSLMSFDPANSHINQNPFLHDEPAVAPVAPVTAPTQKTYNITPKADSSLQVSSALPENTANAAHTLSGLYNEAPAQGQNAHNLINKALGGRRRFSKAGDQLDEAMVQDFTPEEIQAARNTLEGVGAKPTARVQALADMKRQLNEQGYNVLDQASTAEEPLHRVLNYATRAANSTKNPNAVPGSPIQRAANSLQDILNAKSGFANNRVVQKFVSSDGKTKFGTQTELGLTKKNGSLVDSRGTKWTPRATSTTELNANGYDYKPLNEAANQYHSSVGAVKVAQDAKAELIRDPEHYGLIKGAPVTDPLRKYTPVKGIPELNGYYAPRQAAKDIADTFDHPYVPSVAEKAFQGVSTGAIQSIVYNALFHTRNLNELAGLAAGKVKGVTGSLQYKKALYDTLNMTDENKAALNDRMDVGGVVKETYGADHQTVLSDALDKAGMPHINKASPTLMGNIDWGMRRALFHLVTTGDGALGDEEAAALVNRFMGDRQASSLLSRNFGLFWHYMRTRVNVVADAIKHPDENQGTILMAAEQAAVLYGTTKAFQEWTGNKHASLGNPGVFGLVKKVDEVAHGQGVAAATSSINPVVTAIANQAFSKDLYSSKPLNTMKARLANAEQTLVAPLQNTSKVSDGKASVGQEALQMGLGINLPHTKGSPAVPNANNPLADILNIKGAKPVADEKNAQGQVIIHDPTGIDQASLYYRAKDKALQAVAGDPAAADAVNLYLDSNINAKGVKIKKDPSQAMAAAGAVAGSPAALDALKKLEQAQPSHDPMFDLSDKDLKLFLKAQANASSSGVMAADKLSHPDFNNGEGFAKFVQQRDAYYTNNKFAGSDQANPESPTYPSFKGQQNQQYSFYQQNSKNWTPQQKSQYIQNNPLVADALQQINKYYNNLSFAQTGNYLKQAGQFTPAQQTWYNWYNSLPKQTGARSAAIKGNPAMWSSITNTLAQSDLVNLAEQGAVNQYAGVPWQQNFLKDAYNAGRYDINPSSPMPGGGTEYAVQTGTATSTRSSKGSSSKAAATSKQNTQNRELGRSMRAANRTTKAVTQAAHLRGPKRMAVHMRGETNVQAYKTKGATLKARKVNKISLKPNTGLTRSNHVRLKA